MDEVTRARAFEPFFTTKAPGQGSGLGLAMVHGVVHELGGTVWIESALGEGTTVNCLFPALESSSIEELPREQAIPTGNNERILYLDDEDPLVRIAERRLSKLGFRVVPVTSPVVALEVLQAAPHDFDLIVTDFSMPRMSGLEFAAAARKLRPDIPILLLTGYTDAFSDTSANDAGIRQVLRKPLTAAELGIAVHHLLYARG